MDDWRHRSRNKRYAGAWIISGWIIRVGGPQSGGGRATGSGITSLAGDYQRKKLLGVPRKRHRTGRADRHQHIETAHKNLAPLPHAHQQQNPSQEKTVGITVDPESPESFMKLPKRHRWVGEIHTLG